MEGLNHCLRGSIRRRNSSLFLQRIVALEGRGNIVRVFQPIKILALHQRKILMLKGVLEQVEGACVSSNNDGKEALVEDKKEAKEDNGRFVAAERVRDNLSLIEKPPVEVPIMGEKKDCSTDHVACGVTVQMERDTANGFEGRKKVDKDTGDSVADKKETGCVMGQDSSINSTSLGNVEEYNVPCVGPENGHQVHGDCGVANFLRRYRPCDDIGIISDSGNGSSLLFEHREEVEVGCDGLISVVEESAYHVVQDELSVEALETKDTEVLNCYASLSPSLRTLTLGTKSSSDIDFEVEWELYAGPSGDKFQNLSDNVPFFASGIGAGCLLISVNGDTTIQADQICSSVPNKSVDGSMNSTAGSMHRRSVYSIMNKEKVDCNRCFDVIVTSNDSSREKNQQFGLENFKNLQVQCDRGHSEQTKSDIYGHLDEAYIKFQKAFENVECHSSCIESSSSGLDPCSCETLSSFSMKGPSIQKPLHLSTTVFNAPSGPLITKHFHGNNSTDANVASACCGNLEKCCESKVNGETLNGEPVPLIVYRRRNHKCAASSTSMNSQTSGTSDQLTRTRSAAGKCKNAFDTGISILSNKIKVSDKIKRKRSMSRRLASRSVWGEAANLISIFNQAEPPKYSCPTEVQRKRIRTRSVVANEKEKSTWKCKCSTSFRTSRSDSANSVHLNDQMCLQPIFRHVECSTIQASSDFVLSNVVNNADHKLSEGIKLHQCDGQQGEKTLESTLTQDTSLGNVPREFASFSSRRESESLMKGINATHLLDSGSSPESDVYNPVVDTDVISGKAGNQIIRGSGVESQNVFPPEIASVTDLHANVLSSCRASLSLQSASSLDMRPENHSKKGKKEKKGCKITHLEHQLQSYNSENELLKFNRQECGKQCRSDEQVAVHSKSSSRGASKGSVRKAVTSKSAIIGKAKLKSCEKPINSEVDLQNFAVFGQDKRKNEEPLQAVKTKGCNHIKSNKSGASRAMSSSTVPASQMTLDSHVQGKENFPKLVKGRKKDKGQAFGTGVKASERINLSLRDVSKLALAESNDQRSKGNKQGLTEPSCGFEGQILRPQSAWVLCDDCCKWRAISTALADIIDETNRRWVCNNNSDLAFADCSIPQEKTNAEIDAELNISDACSHKDPSSLPLNSNGAVNSKLADPASKADSWMLIKSNLYLHRTRRNQKIHEIMICDCKPPSDGSLGCGDACLNRIVNIECIKGTCPCRDLCSNQQFQRHSYAKFQWFPCGKKGFGLQLLEEVSCGQFLIEYVGEVLDDATHEARQKYYASRGQKHFYFMTLNGGEVIDACAKGNMGRFINHSCTPNCRSEKWMVNGELCIGVFAMRDIKKGEEVTFDYNYEKVVGAAAQKCFCGSSKCKGYIGGNPLSAEEVVQGDSDDEIAEPRTANEVNKKKLDLDEEDFANPAKSVKDEATFLLENGLQVNCTAIPNAEGCQQLKDSVCRKHFAKLGRHNKRR